MATSSRPPITCHVLDTHSGVPAAGIRVTLRLVSASCTTAQERIEFSSETNQDGRVAGWTPTGGSPPRAGPSSMEDVFRAAHGDMRWRIRFDVGEYWEAKNVRPFFPEVEVAFVTQGLPTERLEGGQEHWHVPLLLGPYSYSTYRGS